MEDRSKIGQHRGVKMFCFFRRGLTTACLKAAGTDPELRQELIKTRRLDPTE